MSPKSPGSDSGRYQVSPEGEQEFRDFLQRRTGFVIPEDRWRVLAPRFLARLDRRGFKSVALFVAYLEGDRLGRAELNEIVNVLTVRKTSFFRNPGTFLALRDDVFPALLRERSLEMPVAVWSAGCATGEEAYSLAMVARGALGVLPCYVLATDISEAGLRQAREAWYKDAVLEAIPPEFRAGVRASGGKVWIEDAVKSVVDFANHNLVCDPMPRPATGVWDVIFCRNVLIYFSMAQAREIIDRFTSVLAPGGALFLGSAEVFTDIEDEYEVVFSGDTFYYRKRALPRLEELVPSVAQQARGGPAGERSARSLSETHAMPAGAAAPLSAPRASLTSTPRAAGRPDVARPGGERQPAPLPPPTPRAAERPVARPAGEPQPTPLRGAPRGAVAAPPGSRPAPAADAPTERFARAAAARPPAPAPPMDGDTPTERFPRAALRAFLPPRPGAPPPVRPRPEAGPEADAPALPLDLVAQAQRQLAGGDADGAARTLRAAIARAPRWGKPRVLLAEVYRSRGQSDHARRELEAAVEFAADAKAYHALGTLHAEVRDDGRAELAFRRALFLEPEYVPARYALAQVYRSCGASQQACRELRTVLRDLRNLNASRLGLILEGLSADDVMRRCEEEITAMGGDLYASREWRVPPQPGT